MILVWPKPPNLEGGGNSAHEELAEEVEEIPALEGMYCM